MWSVSGLVLLTLLAGPGRVARAQEPEGKKDRLASREHSDSVMVPPGLNFANGLLRERRYELAAEEYEKFLQSAPPGPNAAQALYGLARAELFLLKYAEARRHLDAFLKMAPDDPNAPTALFRMGEAAYLMRDLRGASQALDAFVNRYPKHPHLDAAWPYLGDVRFGLGDLEGARQAYETALSQYPDGPLADRARYYLARVLNAQGKTDEALARLTEIEERGKPNWVDKARMQTGQFLASAGRAEEAVKVFEAIEQANPTGPQVVEARLRRAEALVALKQFERADPILTALSTDPNTPPAVAVQAAYDLGGSLRDQGQDAKAFEVWNEALGRFPGSNLEAMLLFRSAESLRDLGQLDEANRRFLKVATDHPEDAWADRALLGAARIALEQKRYEQAEKLSEQISARYSGSSLLAEAALVKALAIQGSGRDAEAVPALEALLKSEPPLRTDLEQAARYALGLAYRNTNQPEKAAEMLATMARGSSEGLSTNALYTLGQTEFDARRYEQAIEPLEAFVKANPQGDLTPHALAYLAVAYRERNQPEGEKSALERLAEGWPESEDLVRVRLRLGEKSLGAKDPERAVSLLRPIAEGPAGPWVAQAKSSLGWAYIESEKFQDAASAFAGVLDAEPQGSLAAEAAYMRGWALEKAGEDSAAEQAFAEAAGRFSETEPGAKARLARARLLARTGKPDEAAAVYEKILESPDAHPASESELLSEWGWALYDAGRKDEAFKSFDALFEQDGKGPRSLADRLELGDLAYREDHDLDRAETLLKPVAEPDSRAEPEAKAVALFRLGQIASERKKWDEARSWFTRVIDDFPNGAFREQARFWRAEAAFQGDDPKAAEPEFGELAAAPGEEPWRDSARLRQIQCLVKLAQWGEVIQKADQLLSENPEFPQKAEVQYARGQALQTMAPPDFEKAREAYQDVIASQPGTNLAAQSQFMTGETFYLEKNDKEAERAFLAVDLTYNAPKVQAAALLELGKVYERQGRNEDARACYQKLLEKFPEDALAEDARKRVRDL
ncbi:MAG TPA: tetratricopeptide repeat protein [Isosphaeraceae bacterium]|nr:tetratricopeptide repeat protein [Isosphaeraceae bacterium]